MNNYNLEKINKWLIVLLILIQPIINIIRNVFINDIQILGISAFEMLNVILVMLSLFITIYLYHDKKKFLKYLIFFILFLIYSVFHYINILNFNSNVYENYNPNFLSEIYYLFRTFIISLLLIVNVYYSDIKKQTVIRIIEFLSLIISSVIVLSNLFKIGFLSYGEGICQLNLFDWFTFKSTSAYSYYSITCKGWFSSANQISSILFMILPIILYLAYRKRCVFNYSILVLHTLAMFMLGTKTANLGVILVYLFFIVFYFILRVLKKTNHSILPIIMIFLCFCILFLYSPFYHNVSNSSNQQSIFERAEKEVIEEEVIEEEVTNKNIKEGYGIFEKIKKYDCSKLSTKEKNNIVNFYENYSSYLGVPDYILQNYKVENHINFWCNYIVDYSSIDYRNLKTNILRNIYKENNNEWDKFFGLGYSLNYIYTESDYSYQYYIYGIFGILLFLAPYFLIILYLGISILKNFKSKFNLENIMYLLGPMLSLVIAYYSGHVLERTFPLLVMSLLVALNLINYKKEPIREEKIMFVSDDNKNLKKLSKLTNVLESYDYRIVTEKTDYSLSLKKKYGRKIEYLEFCDKNKVLNKIFKSIYNILKCLYLYIKFNPKTIVMFLNERIKIIYYIGKIFGSKIIFVESFVDNDKLSKKISSDDYLITFNTSNKIKKVLFISSTGGHLNELLQLKPLFKKFNSYLITEKTKSTKDLSKEFEKVNYLVYGTKDHKLSYIFKFTYNCFKSLLYYIKIRPKVIITTGTHTAVPMCYIGKLFGSKIIFIETFANSKTKTLSGKLVYPIADTFIVQWESMLELYPKAVYAGWIY